MLFGNEAVMGARVTEMPVPLPSPHSKEMAKLKLGPGPQGPACSVAPAPHAPMTGGHLGCYRGTLASQGQSGC